MKILYLAHRIPYPPNKGDKIRTFNEIKCLSQKHDIHLLTLADDPKDLEYQTDLKKYCSRVSVFGLNTWMAKLRSAADMLLSKKSLSVTYFYDKRLQLQMDLWLTETSYDAVLCFSSPMAEYLFRSRRLEMGNFKDPKSKIQNPKSRYPLLIMDFCDVDSQKWAQYAQNSRLPMRVVYSIESRRLFDYEKKINRMFHHSVFVSDHEVELFKSKYEGARNLTAIPNGVDHKYFSPEAKFASIALRDYEDQKVLVFTGAMDYYANVEGVCWFCRKILPKIKNLHPNMLFYIVGTNPTQEVKSLEAIDGVRVTGFVADIRPYYRNADVCVIPLRIAAGVQNKVLEAMAMGTPVVTTAKAFEGINGKPSVHALVEDQPEQFSDKVLQLLNNKKKSEQLAQNARELILEKYNWQTNMKNLERLISMGPTAPNKGTSILS